MIETFKFFVAGECQPQGSKKGFHIKSINRVVMVDANKDTKKWRERIATEAQRANSERMKSGMKSFFEPEGKAYVVHAEFKFVRPKSYPKSFIYRHTKKPDLDKLIRSVFDGMTDVLYHDDNAIDGVSAHKSYCVGEEQPGCWITVTMDDERWKN